MTEVIASGGGVRNPTLMAALREELAPVALLTSDALGLPAQAKEAYAFAVLGFLTHHGIAGHARERDRRPPRERARLHHTRDPVRDPLHG